jgi:hypothetical protein
MAIGATTDQQITATTTLGRNQAKFSMAAWIRRPASGSRQNCGFLTGSWCGLVHFSDNNMYFCLHTNGNNNWGRCAANITGWNHFVHVFDGSASGNAKLLGYINGVSSITEYAVGSITATATPDSSNTESFSIGRDSINNTWSSGDFAEVAIWHEALTAQDVNSLSKGFSPASVRPDSLKLYMPLVRNIIDYKANLTLTNTNTTVANHPRVYA